MNHRCRLTLAAAAVLLAHAARADDLVLQRILIEGARASGIGVSDSASAGTISGKQLTQRTVYRPGELLEAAPGIVVSQHSGEGKANQFFLRGFNLDHGTDLRTSVDDMPVNQRSHAHGQGWTDLNFLIPELAARLDYKKGPYSAREGDFASAGSAAITYANRLTQGVANASLGQDGYLRSVLANSQELGKGSLLYALEVLRKDGPFTMPDDYRKLNAVLRYSEGFANNGYSVTAMAYRSSWNATDQIPQRAVAGGALGRFDALDRTDGGAARRYSLSGVWRRTAADSSSKVSAYVLRNELDLFSNFTYFLDDPVNGDQFSQPDRRVTSGVNASHTWHLHDGSVQSDLTFGAQLQNDNIINGLHATRARQQIGSVRDDHIVETSLGLFIEQHTRWNDWLRTLAGVRADHYRFNVRSSLAANSGSARDSIASPSLNVVMGPWQKTEAYFNAGTGFHSNDARGTLTRVDPKSGAATSTVPGLVRSRGLELGVRSEWIPGLQSALAVYRLDFNSELTFVGDAGTTEAGRPSRRNGVELSNYYKPAKWLSVDLDLAYAKARWNDNGAGGAFIPGAVEGVAQLALTLDQGGPWSGSLRLRHVGARPLVEDDSVRAPSSTTLNGRIGYRLRKGMHLELEGFNLTNRSEAAITYYYASRLKNEATARDDLHFHPLEPRSLRLALVVNW